MDVNSPVREGDSRVWERLQSCSESCGLEETSPSEQVFRGGPGIAGCADGEAEAYGQWVESRQGESSMLTSHRGHDLSFDNPEIKSTFMSNVEVVCSRLQKTVVLHLCGETGEGPQSGGRLWLCEG